MHELKIRKSLNNLGLSDIKVYISNELANLPFIYQKKFAVYDCVLIDINQTIKIAVLLKPNDEKFNINEFVANYIYLKNNIDSKLVIGLDNITNFYKGQLIRARIPFLLFDTDNIFVPFLGTYLSESNFIEKSDFYQKPFTSIEQRILLLILYTSFDRNIINPTLLLNNSDISKPSIYRMFNRLSKAGLFKKDRFTTYKNWNITQNKKDIWDKFETLLNSPIVKRVYFNSKFIDQLKAVCEIYIGGISALSIYTNLADDNTKTFVASLSDEKKIMDFLNLNTNVYVNRNEKTYLDDYCELQFWRYKPIIIEKSRNEILGYKLVDELSLYLSLGHNHDSRIESELNTLLKTVINGEHEKLNESI